MEPEGAGRITQADGAPVTWGLIATPKAQRRGICLRFGFNFVNDHAARPVVRERLTVIAVASMHPYP